MNIQSTGDRQTEPTVRPNEWIKRTRKIHFARWKKETKKTPTDCTSISRASQNYGRTLLICCHVWNILFRAHTCRHLWTVESIGFPLPSADTATETYLTNNIALWRNEELKRKNNFSASNRSQINSNENCMQKSLR